MKTRNRALARYAVTLMMALVLAVGFGFKAYGGSGSKSDKARGESAAKTEDAKKAPPITPADAKKIEALLKKSKGKVTVLNLWATWCPPCVAEIPHLIEFYKETDRKKVEFIALSADDPASADTAVRAFQKSREIPFPIYVLTERDPDALAKVLKTELSGAIPTTLIYDKKGKLQESWEGSITLEQLMKKVKPLL